MELDWIRRVIVRDLAAVEREIAAYPDEPSLWQLVPGISNPAGVLALHLAGNLQHFVGARLAGSGYARDRPAEFAKRRSRAEILQELERARLAVDEALRSLDDGDMETPFPESFGGRQLSSGQFLLHLATHLAYHLGQIDYHRRILLADSKTVEALSIPRLLDPDPSRA